MAARRTYSPTAVLPIPIASPTRRRLIPSACVRRNTSRIFLIETLSAGIGPPPGCQGDRSADSTVDGNASTPSSPAVRNHRIAVRLALETVSALHRIPQPIREYIYLYGTVEGSSQPSGSPEEWDCTTQILSDGRPSAPQPSPRSGLVRSAPCSFQYNLLRTCEIRHRYPSRLVS
jgi:hypothetical protein